MAPAWAAVTSTTQHDISSTGLNSQIEPADLLAGLIATELPGDTGWHPANPAATDPTPLDNPDGLPAFTDGAGILGSGLTGLLNDFPGSGNPTKRVQYDLAGAKTIREIKVLTGNNGRDGRVYSTFAIYTSTDGGGAFDLLGYFQSDPLGSVNNAATPDAERWGSTLVTVFDDASPVLASAVTNLQFDFYAVDNTQGRYQDPFNGVNPFTGLDDLFGEAVASPLLFEIDVVQIPEPATAAILTCGLGVALALTGRRR
jgi:hypothetical protein